MASSESQEIRWVGELQRCDVKSGDRFVLSVPEPITPEVADYLRRAWTQFIGGDVPLLILEPGMKIGVFGSETQQ